MKIELNFTHKRFALKYFKVFPNRFQGKVFKLVSWSTDVNRHKLNPLHPAGTQ